MDTLGDIVGLVNEVYRLEENQANIKLSVDALKCKLSEIRAQVDGLDCDVVKHNAALEINKIDTKKIKDHILSLQDQMDSLKDELESEGEFDQKREAFDPRRR